MIPPPLCAYKVNWPATKRPLTPTWPSWKRDWSDTLTSPKKPSIPTPGKSGDARLDLVPQLADCNPGLRPVEYNVIVAPASATEETGKIGSIFIPDTAKEDMELAQQVARIIDQSPLAYDFAVWPDPSLNPQIGQTVWIARYAGKEFTGRDGQTYRILKDKDIGAVIPEDISQEEAKATIGAAEDKWSEHEPGAD